LLTRRHTNFLHKKLKINLNKKNNQIESIVRDFQILKNRIEMLASLCEEITKNNDKSNIFNNKMASNDINELKLQIQAKVDKTDIL